MRLLFLLMLLANVAYVGWELFYPKPQHHRVVVQDPGVKQLVLLSELPHVEKILPQEKVAAPVAVTDASAPQSKKTPASSPDQKAAQVPETVSPKTVVTQTTPGTPAKPDMPVFACYTLGPFRELAKLHKLIRSMHNYVAEATYRSHDEREQSMYWVYLPKQKSYAAAKALAERLKRKHIRDYYVIPKGDQANTVSLGYFKDRDGALSVQKKAKAAGFRAIIEPQFKVYTIYWLDYRVRTDVKIPGSVLDLSRLPNVSRLERNCK